jgi:hypothetical protein
MASRAKGVVRRENIITALLLIASARWHFALLAAGALWRGKSSAPRQKTSILTAPFTRWDEKAGLPRDAIRSR